MIFFDRSRHRHHLLHTVSLVLALTSTLLATSVQAEPFSLTDMDGKTHTTTSYKGKWVLVNFWATWCPPCLEEIPDLIALQDSHKNLIVIGIAMDYKSKQEVAKFADDNLINYPLVLGNDKLARQFGSAEILPTTYIYNPQGKLVKVHRGLISRNGIEKLMLEK
jgi:thiol-disulfide isomerase/thioredoxin